MRDEEKDRWNRIEAEWQEAMDELHGRGWADLTYPSEDDPDEEPAEPRVRMPSHPMPYPEYTGPIGF